jgi:hypothetical protein
MSEIVAIEITHHQLPLDPPFPASWDPQPRTKFPVTIVRVRDSEGREGIGSGDVMYGFADYARYFVGQQAGDLERHASVLANVEFHAGRPWPLDLALWAAVPDRVRPPQDVVRTGYLHHLAEHVHAKPGRIAREHAEGAAQLEIDVLDRRILFQNAEDVADPGDFLRVVEAPAA